MTPLRRQKPGQQLAFLPYPDIEPLAECLVAFANSAGGLIILGLDENGMLTDEIMSEDAESSWQQAMGLTQPPVIGQWQTIPISEGTRLVGIRVNRSDDLHSLVDGRILVRSGRENRPLTGDEVTQIASGRTSGDYEEEEVPGATAVGHFDPALIDEYLSKREARGQTYSGSRDQLLHEIGAITPDGQPTVTGLLLFSANPQAFLPHCGALFVRFPSTAPRTSSGLAGYGRRDEINGPLPRIIERLWNIIWEEMRVGAVINDLSRQELPEYPRFAVREALVNAVAHRDYRIKGRRIEVRMYSDRLEIISPGGLPGYITLDNLIEEHYSRNPRMVNGLYQWGYIEELGLGIDLMIEEMAQQGHPPPDFRATSYSFTVTLSNERSRRPAQQSEAWTQSMNERQARALTYVHEHGSVTNREYQRLCEGVTAETLRRDLADLVSRGILLKVGSKKGTYYILK